MKVARFVLKIVAVSMAVMAAACCIIAYWDRIVAFLGCARDKIAEKKDCLCHHSENDDYADWDEA